MRIDVTGADFNAMRKKEKGQGKVVLPGSNSGGNKDFEVRDGV
jgi:hypothetical protein